MIAWRGHDMEDGLQQSMPLASDVIHLSQQQYFPPLKVRNDILPSLPSLACPAVDEADREGAGFATSWVETPQPMMI